MHAWMWRKGDPHALLMTVYTSVLTLEISSKVLNKMILCSSFITPSVTQETLHLTIKTLAHQYLLLLYSQQMGNGINLDFQQRTNR